MAEIPSEALARSILSGFQEALRKVVGGDSTLPAGEGSSSQGVETARSHLKLFSAFCLKGAKDDEMLLHFWVPRDLQLEPMCRLDRLFLFFVPLMH